MSQACPYCATDSCGYFSDAADATDGEVARIHELGARYGLPHGSAPAKREAMLWTLVANLDEEVRLLRGLRSS